MRYLIVIGKTSTGYSAYAPDLPGCVTTSETVTEAEQEMREAIEFHLEGLQEEGYETPAPRSTAAYVDVAA